MYAECSCPVMDSYRCLAEERGISYAASVEAGGCRCECHELWPTVRPVEPNAQRRTAWSGMEDDGYREWEAETGEGEC